MRFAFLAVAALAFAAPAFAQDAVKLPEKLTTPGFQAVIADVGPAYIAGQPSEQALRDLAAKGVTTVISLRTQGEMDNRKAVPFDEAAAWAANAVYVCKALELTAFTVRGVEEEGVVAGDASGRAKDVVLGEPAMHAYLPAI